MCINYAALRELFGIRSLMPFMAKVRKVSNWGESVLERMDSWAEDSEWWPTREEFLRKDIFWWIFMWNVPILAIAMGLAVVVVEASNVMTSGYHTFPINVIGALEFLAVSLALALFLDFWMCLAMRKHWNRRAYALQQELE